MMSMCFYIGCFSDVKILFHLFNYGVCYITVSIYLNSYIRNRIVYVPLCVVEIVCVCVCVCVCVVIHITLHP